MLVQSLPLTSAQVYAVDTLWPHMRIGDALELVRAPDNRDDRDAIRAEWQGH